ncbi:unnamed protein product [Trifolium pratense]|uniref:Uncharacterized protein n=1 Tax=Trifolium pratense TaxID=57577 RepID=A0ACB0LJR5_TRIPR|nr:unnamed protein product [Trifolium pratense]
MFEDDGTSRTKLLTHLGFNAPSETKDTVSDDLSQEVNSIGLEDTTVNNVGHVATNDIHRIRLLSEMVLVTLTNHP